MLCRWETRLPFTLKLLPRVQLLQQSPVKAVPHCPGPGRDPGSPLAALGAASALVWWGRTLLPLHEPLLHRQVDILAVSGLYLMLLPSTEVINTTNSSPSSWFLLLLHFMCNPHLYFCCFSPRVEVHTTKFTKECNLMSIQWFSLWLHKGTHRLLDFTKYLDFVLLNKNNCTKENCRQVPNKTASSSDKS